MPRTPDFTKATRRTLAKRANQLCSNPYCQTRTSGPHSDSNRSVDVGEACHIKGARPGAKRYDPTMSDEERSAIVNGIWLCRKCGKLIDSDQRKYSVKVLYKWKRDHEARIAMELEGGKQDRELTEWQLRAFEGESPVAYQIALDKPDYWEFLLTRELLRDKMEKARRQYQDLLDGLIYRPSKILRDKWDVKYYLQEKLNDITAIMRMLTQASSVELKRAWGAHGEPGDPIEILTAVQRIADAHKALLDWEIDLYFTKFPDKYEEIREMMTGWTAVYLDETERIEFELSRLFSEGPVPEGTHEINLVYDSPPEIDSLAPKFKQLWDTDPDVIG